MDEAKRQQIAFGGDNAAIDTTDITTALIMPEARSFLRLNAGANTGVILPTSNEASLQEVRRIF